MGNSADDYYPSTRVTLILIFMILYLWSEVVSLALDSQAKAIQKGPSPFVNCKVNRVQ